MFVRYARACVASVCVCMCLRCLCLYMCAFTFSSVVGGLEPRPLQSFAQRQRNNTRTAGRSAQKRSNEAAARVEPKSAPPEESASLAQCVTGVVRSAASLSSTPPRPPESGSAHWRRGLSALWPWNCCSFVALRVGVGFVLVLLLLLAERVKITKRSRRRTNAVNKLHGFC